MDDRIPNSSESERDFGETAPAGASPNYPVGSPLEMRDGTLHRHPVIESRSGEPKPGLSAEGEPATFTHPTVTPTVTRRGWATGGMAIPALLIVAILVAVGAWAL